MKLRHQDIFINPYNPFEGCKLERKQYADTLTELVKTFSDGFVLAVNNKWGAGKTTFIKMWKRQMELSGFKTLYFNAWENDFEANPMSAILAELKSLLPETKKDKFKPLIEKGTVIVKNLLPSIAKALVGNYIDIKSLDDVAENAIKGGVEILEEEIENYSKRQKGLNEFQDELVEYLQNVSEGKPLIFIVDELDRCRPNYAVEVLENIKHFFTVKGFVFVLSIDKDQLGNAVKGVYGTDLINTDEYLRRFIDLEYSIPEPSTKTFVNYLYSYYSFAIFLENPRRIARQFLRNEPSSFLDFSIFLFEGHGLTLRQQEKLFSHVRISLTSFDLERTIYPQAFIFLTYIYQYNKQVYFYIKNRNYNLRDFSKAISVLFPTKLSLENAKLSLTTFTILLYLYNNYYKEIDRNSQIIDENNELRVDIIWQIPNAFEYIKRVLNTCDQEYYNMQIYFLLNKIELLENVKF